MKKIFAMIMAVVILTTTAVAADFNPGTKIRFNGNEDRWEGELKSINSENYSVSSVKWTQGKDLVSSVTINDDDEVLVVALKPDYKSTKAKDLEGTIKLREKGKTRYATLSINCTVGYNVVNLGIDANGDISVPTIDSGSIYRIKDNVVTRSSNGRGYGTLSFSAGDADISVRVYDGEVYYLAHDNDAIKSVLTANTDTDANIDFLTFPGTPTFNATATVNFYDVEEDQFIYELNNGRLTRSAAKWSDENGSWELKTRTLGSYVISDKALKSPAGNSTGGNNTGADGDNNPDTGANDVTGIATALALASLASAAAVSLKKQK